jgi:hypothetical protein
MCTIDPPPALIAVPVSKALPLLTEAEYVRGIRRGKWRQRRQAEVKREVATLDPKNTTSAEETPTLAVR